MEKSVLIAYFSGTGSTKFVAESIEQVYSKNSINTLLYSIDSNQIMNMDNVEALILLYPVYAFNAPLPITEWIDTLPKASGLQTAVLSVSGGGEVWPNSLSRVECKRRLESKGFFVFYEEMIVMPSNIFVKTKDHLSMWLVKSLPIKVEKIVNEIILKKRKRKAPRFGLGLNNAISKFEVKSLRKYGLSLEANEKCTGCRSCERNCPRSNIVMVEDRPKFEDKCIACLRCVYGCPTRSIYSSKYNFLAIKDGYSVSALCERMLGVELESIESCGKGLLWIGVRKYLLEIHRDGKKR